MDGLLPARAAGRRIAGLCLSLVLGWTAPILAADSAPIDFRLPAGSADVSLERFSEQSGVPLVYMADAVKDVRTQAVSGRLTAREALDRMIAGTDLVAASDMASGAFAISRRPAPKDAPPEESVVMRSFVVAATGPRVPPWLTGPGATPWFYGSLPGIEVLTRAPEDQADWVVRGVQRGLWVQRRIIPVGWLAEYPVPPTLIVDDTAPARTPAARTHSDPLIFKTAPDAPAWGGAEPRLGFGQLKAADRDTFSSNINLHNAATTGLLTDSGWGLKQRLAGSVPALPDWLLAGLIGRCGIMRESFAFVPADSYKTFWPDSVMIGAARNRVPDSETHVEKIVGPGTLWLSLEDTAELVAQLKKDPGTRIPLMPLSEFFAVVPGDGPKRDLWESEAGLFARWALLGGNRRDPKLVRSLSRFVSRARTGPVTERSFTESFGYGYAKAEAELETFLRRVIGRPATLPADFDRQPLDLSPPRWRQATADQEARILADWLRMKGNSLRSSNPQLSEQFLNACGRVIRKALANSGGGDRRSPSGPLEGLDPGLLGVIGLYLVDTGKAGEGRAYLEAAARGKVARPEVYLALARTRSPRNR